ncbi:MAG TPA: ABC transporter permease [Candidatus Acetothermia bacterium]|nr:ABC transporter permease [Candidatus Acetothermia bacterium]
MLQYIIRRLLLTFPVLFGVSLLVFSIIRLIPGDPAEAMAGPHATREMIERIRTEFGLDKPIHLQFLRFMSGLLRGDLGRSIRTQRPVMAEILDRLPHTLELAAASMLLATVFGMLAGIISAAKPYSFFDHLSMFLALVGISLPVFWLGLMLMLLFSLKLGWLPAAGRGTLAHLVLPSITLAAASMALIARMTRSSLLEVLRQEYVVAARAKGLPERDVLFRHALKNALVPVITIIGLRFGTLLSGAVLTETVFAWPGVGRLMVDSISARDYPVVQGAVLVLALSFVFINLAVDLLYAVFNPRIRYD